MLGVGDAATDVAASPFTIFVLERNRIMNPPTIGWSNFARINSTAARGNSYTTLNANRVVELVQEHWDKRIPGAGEVGKTERKVLVPVPPTGFFCPPRAKLVEGLPLQSQVVVRQPGEDPYIETFTTPEQAKAHQAFESFPAAGAEIVCYSAEALLENDGKRTTNDDWEIVCILAREGGLTPEPMKPLAMARNMLQKPGGTKGEYTAEEFAESIYYWSNRGVKVREVLR